jgi:purine catabolism regulator
MTRTTDGSKTAPPPLPEVAVGSGARPLAEPGLEYGLTVRDVLATRELRRSRVLAGQPVTARLVEHVVVADGDGIASVARPRYFVVAPGWVLDDLPSSLADLVGELDARGVAALGVHRPRPAAPAPAAMVDAAERAHFPLIELPEDLRLEGLPVRVLAELVQYQAVTLARDTATHRALERVVLSGGGLQEVADELVRLLGGAVFVAAADGRVLASSGHPDVVAAAHATDAFDASGRLAAGPRPAGVYLSTDGRRSFAVAPLVAGPAEHGRLVAFSGTRRLGTDDLRALERAATVAALAMARRRAAAAVEAKQQADLARDLVAGRLGHERALAAAAEFGWDLDRPLVVIVSALDPLPEAPWRDSLPARPLQERFAAAWSAVLLARDPRAAVSGFAEEVVCLVGGRGDAGELARGAAARVGADASALRGSFTTGISRVVAGAPFLPEAYEQALRAIDVGRQVHGPGSVTDFNGLGVYRLLSLVPDGAELRGFVRETLGELVEREDAETRDLRQTLEVLLETNLNVAETARRQHFHYNTLRYRIAKLERMLGSFTDDPQLRLSLMVALQVLRMRGVGS